MKHNSHENDSILFERWELKIVTKQQQQQSGKRIVHPILHVVDVDCFGDSILAVEDYTAMELTDNVCEAMVMVVLPFTKGWPNKVMSSY